MKTNKKMILATVVISIFILLIMASRSSSGFDTPVPRMKRPMFPFSDYFSRFFSPPPRMLSPSIMTPAVPQMTPPSSFLPTTPSYFDTPRMTRPSIMTPAVTQMTPPSSFFPKTPSYFDTPRMTPPSSFFPTKPSYFDTPRMSPSYIRTPAARGI
jgi:hypothetical protein